MKNWSTVDETCVILWLWLVLALKISFKYKFLNGKYNNNFLWLIAFISYAYAVVLKEQLNFKYSKKTIPV